MTQVLTREEIRALADNPEAPWIFNLFERGSSFSILREKGWLLTDDGNLVPPPRE